MLPITSKLLPVPTQRRSGLKNLGITYIVAHDTGNDGSTAMGNVNYYIQSDNDMQASAHYFVDDIAIIDCVPEDEKAWHVRYNAGVAPNIEGNFANDHALGIELCYGSAWGMDRNMKSYNNYTDLMAALCKKYNIDPHTKIIQHAQLDPTRRTDPLNAFKYVGKSWEQFLADVAAKVVGTPMPPPVVDNSAKKAHILAVLEDLKAQVQAL